MKKTNKKAFTIVELVIVIAVIAILAAVLIPTFSSIIKKANVSSDTQIIRNANTALATDLKEHATMTEALKAAESYGLNISKINAKATGNEILWDSANDVFCYYNGTTIEYIPETTTTKTAKEWDYWEIVDIKSENPTATVSDKKWSLYARSTTVDTVTVASGFDVGDCTFTSITYENSHSAQEVVIRSNTGSLVVEDKSATSKIYHYGYAGLIDIKQCAKDSYYEYGTTNIMDITAGHVVLTKDAVVNKEVQFSRKENEETYKGDIILTVETEEMPAFTRDALGTSGISTQLVCEVKDSSSSEYIWITADGTEEHSNIVFTDTNATPTEENIISGSSDTQTIGTDIANTLNGSGAGAEVVEKGLDEDQKETAKEAAENGKFVRVSNASNEELNGLTSIEEMSYIINGGTYAGKDYIADTDAYVGATIELLANMNLKDTNWMPWGTNASSPFMGCALFDGNGYTISGLAAKNTTQYVNSAGTLAQPCGLIGYLLGDITFKDLTIDVNIDTTSISGVPGCIGAYIGCIVGDNSSGSYINKGTVTFNSCKATGTINAGDKIGGFIGTAYKNYGCEKLIFTDCTNEVNITSTDRAAGFVGSTSYATYISFTNCINKGSVTNKGSYACGGLIGYLGDCAAPQVIFSNCGNQGTLKFGSSNGHGFIGYCQGDVTYKVTVNNVTTTYEWNRNRLSYLDD